MAIDFGGVQTTDNYSSGFVPKLQESQKGLACLLDPAYITYTGTPYTGAKRLNAGLFEQFNGTSWVALATGYVTLANAETISGLKTYSAGLISTGLATPAATGWGVGNSDIRSYNGASTADNRRSYLSSAGGLQFGFHNDALSASSAIWTVTGGYALGITGQTWNLGGGSYVWNYAGSAALNLSSPAANTTKLRAISSSSADGAASQLSIETTRANASRLDQIINSAGGTAGISQQTFGSAITAKYVDIDTHYFRKADGTQIAKLDSSLNLTVAGGAAFGGATPTTMNSTFRGLELNARSALLSNAGASGHSTYLSTNTYYSTGSLWLAKQTGNASLLTCNDDGSFVWYQSSGSVAAGAAISWIEKFKIDAGGIVNGSFTRVAPAYAPMSMSQDAGATVGNFVCFSGTTGDAGLAGMTFWNNAGYAIKMGVRADGYFGLGGWSRAAWSWYSDPSGNMVAAGNVTAYSDPRLKENFAPVIDAMGILKQLQGGTFTWRHGFAHTAVKAGKRDYGILADQVEAVMPEIVSPSIDIEGESYQTVAYEKLVPVLIEAIKQLDCRAAALEGRA